MSAPRFSAAVLEALARVQATRRRIRRDQFGAAFDLAWQAHDAALTALWTALDAEHPVPVGDETTRDPSPHRFKATHGSEPL